MTDEFAKVRARWKQLSFYQKFEHAVIFILSALIAILVVLAVWTLVLKIFASVRASSFDPTDYSAFQVVFGMIFTVIIALEFEPSLLVIAERDRGVVQVRTVILNGTCYQDLGPDHFDRRAKTTKTKHLVARLQNLGYAVQITPLAA